MKLTWKTIRKSKQYRAVVRFAWLRWSAVCLWATDYDRHRKNQALGRIVRRKSRARMKKLVQESRAEMDQLHHACEGRNVG